MQDQCYSISNPSKFFSAIQSYCFCLSVSLFSYESKSTLLQLDDRKKIGWELSSLSRIFLRSSCISTRANQLINERNMTGQLKKWDGMLQYPSRSFPVIQSYHSLSAIVRHQTNFIHKHYNQMTEKNWTGIYKCTVLLDQIFCAIPSYQSQSAIVRQESKTTDKRQQNNWRAKKNLDGYLIQVWQAQQILSVCLSFFQPRI